MKEKYYKDGGIPKVGDKVVFVDTLKDTLNTEYMNKTGIVQAFSEYDFGMIPIVWDERGEGLDDGKWFARRFKKVESTLRGLIENGNN